MKKQKCMTRKVKNKKEAEYYLSKGAILISQKGNEYYFDQNETEMMQLEFRLLIKNKKGKLL